MGRGGRRRLERALLIASVPVAWVLASGAGCVAPVEAPSRPRPLDFEVRIGGDQQSDLALSLRLHRDDGIALGLASPTVLGEPDRVIIRTGQVWSTDRRSYCLTQPAELTVEGSEPAVAVIPVATCLGRSPALLVPTADDPTIDAVPETHQMRGGTTTRTVSGVLDVRIDGCSTIGGTRVIWPSNTAIDPSGNVVSDAGPTLANGSVVSVEVRTTFIPDEANPCPGSDPLYVEAIE